MVQSRTLETVDNEEIHPPSDIRTGENTGIYAREKMQVHKITSNTTSTEETTTTTKQGFFQQIKNTYNEVVDKFNDHPEIEPIDQSNNQPMTLSENEKEKSPGGEGTGETEPKLFVDVNVANFGLQRIVVYEGDTVESLVADFVKRCPIDEFMVEKLKLLLQQQMDGVLERIDEDEDSDDEHVTPIANVSKIDGKKIGEDGYSPIPDMNNQSAYSGMTQPGRNTTGQKVDEE